MQSCSTKLSTLFSVRSNGYYSINLLSPATYMKQGSEDYWKGQEKYKFWKTFSPKGLATAKEISTTVFNFLNEGSPLISGNEIFLDGGLFNLYPDQNP